VHHRFTITRRASAALALGASVVALWVVPAPSRAYTPPVGTPDLGAMLLGPSDFAAAGLLTGQGYAHSAPFVTYWRDFAFVTTTRGDKLLEVYAEANYSPNVGDAESYMSVAPLVFDSRSFRRSAARSIVFDALQGGVRVRARNVRFGRISALPLGDAALTMSMSVKVGRARLTSEAVFVRVDRVVAFLSVVGVPQRNENVGGDTAALAATVAARLRAGLAAQGPAGGSQPAPSTQRSAVG
jgi:hypothetical protein